MNKDGFIDLLYTTEDLITFLTINRGGVQNPNFALSLPSDFSNFSENGLGSGTILANSSLLTDVDSDGELDHLFTYTGDDPDFPPPYAVEWNWPDLSPIYKFWFFEEQNLTDFNIPYLPLFTLDNFIYKDFDADGDDDILAHRYYEKTTKSAFVYYERADKKKFKNAVVRPFGLTDSVERFDAFPFSIDVDKDNDLDLLLLKPDGNWLYYENVGTAQTPFFKSAVLNPFGLSTLPNNQGFSLRTFDLNNDGYQDVMAIDRTNFYYFEFDKGVTAMELKTLNIDIVPSLVHSFFEIKGVDYQDIDRIIFWNTHGQIQQYGQVTSSEVIDIGAFLSGCYFLEIRFKDGSTATRKILKY